MELYEEIEEKKSKAPLIIGISITILLILTAVVVVGIMYVKDMIVTVKVDGKTNNNVEQLLYIPETDTGLKMYVPIVKVAKNLGYEGYVGHYQNKSEDNTKCHVSCEFETAMFTLDSNELIKITNGTEFEYITLDEPVFEKDGELYTTMEGIEKAFNASISTDATFKNINIFTMNYLVQYFAQQFKIEKYDAEFTDQKAVLENMLIVEENKKFGVVDVEKRQYILEPKYDEVKYLSATTDFLVKSNGKYGVVAKDNTTKINTVYDEIKTMDNKVGLYLVKKDKAYGVVNTAGQDIIPLNYKQIGVEIKDYTQNGVENQYILLNELIPVKNDDNLWALFNTKGEQKTEFKYTQIGCKLKPVTNSYPTLIIPSYKIVVVQNDKYYNLVNTNGEELIDGSILDSVYLKYDTTAKQNKFYMAFSNNTKIIDIEQWLISIGK